MKKDLIKIIIASILLAIGIIVKFDNIWINNSILIVSYIIVGFEVLKEALENILHRELFDENFLMTVATIGAFAIGEYPEAVAVMLFYQVGELFQSYAVDKSKKSITNLMDIRPDYANLIKGEEIEKVNPDTIEIGDFILIKPGEKIPLDGIVVDGESFLDTKALTGENVPREVTPGSEVLSGCINQKGLLKVKVTKEYGESTVSKILELVENASHKKAKSENFITKFAKYYTPTVVIIALFLAFVPPLIIGDFSGTFQTWLYRALSFLVVSCPCALVISIPLSFFGGIGGASRKGILVKGGNHLEDLSKTEIVVFDKTGTLTEGVFEVQKIESVNLPEEELLKYAAYGEYYSNHPIANSIKNAYKEQIDTNQVKNVQELSGHGVKAEVFNKEILIGNNKLMETHNIKYVKSSGIGTILYIAINNEFAGTITIADKIKDDSIKAINELHKNGIKTVMLTGDKKETGDKIGKILGIKNVHTELLPDEKVEKVEEFINKTSDKGKLAFVGDGINDAPVLAISDIGIAMGALGSDAAIEAADVVFMNDKPSNMNIAIKIAKKTMRIVKENIVFAILVKLIVLGLTATGLTTMWWAVFADVGVSVIAIINAIRLLKK